jgi:hypothetical protein
MARRLDGASHGKGHGVHAALPRVVAACIDDAVIPFARLAPYLTPNGKALVAMFEAEVKGRK